MRLKNIHLFYAGSQQRPRYTNESTNTQYCLTFDYVNNFFTSLKTSSIVFDASIYESTLFMNLFDYSFLLVHLDYRVTILQVRVKSLFEHGLIIIRTSTISRSFQDSCFLDSLPVAFRSTLGQSRNITCLIIAAFPTASLHPSTLSWLRGYPSMMNSFFYLMFASFKTYLPASCFHSFFE